MSLSKLIVSPFSEGAGQRSGAEFGLGALASGLIQDEGFADIDTGAVVVPAHLAMRTRPAAAVWRRRARLCRSRRAELLRPRRPRGPSSA